MDNVLPLQKSFYPFFKCKFLFKKKFCDETSMFFSCVNNQFQKHLERSPGMMMMMTIIIIIIEVFFYLVEALLIHLALLSVVATDSAQS